MKLYYWGLFISAAVVVVLILMVNNIVPRPGFTAVEPDPVVPASTSVEPAPEPAPAEPGSAVAEPATAVAPPARSDSGWSAVAYRKEAPAGVATLISINSAHLTEEGGFDRIGLHFQGAVLPGVSAEYTAKILQDGSDQPAQLAGNAFIQLKLLQAKLPDAKSGLTQPSRGATLNRPQLRAFTLNGTAGNIISIGLGLDHGADNKSVFRITEVSEKTESVVYVDIR